VATATTPADVAPVPPRRSGSHHFIKRTGVVLAFDVAGLAELAQRADCVIEFRSAGGRIRDGR